MSLETTIILVGLIIGCAIFIFRRMERKAPRKVEVIRNRRPAPARYVHVQPTAPKREWRKKTATRCPSCQSVGGHVGHRGCPSNGKLWVDILSGTVMCDICHKSWSLENSTHYCGCGAKFRGGELWAGMAEEIRRVGNRAWIRRMGISKGSMKTQFIGYWK